ncbi:MAG: ABC transporter permease [Acidobacteria bacterium]|nr:ABC transporter permease [Acidobacteriota bacterium]
MLRKNPGFTILAALTVALGIGANTAMFSVIQAVFLRPLPFADQHRLVMLSQNDGLVSPANLVDWEAQNGVFEHLGAWPGMADYVAAFNIIGRDGSAARVRGVYVSSGFFRALATQPVLGRTFFPEEDRLREHRPAVLSYSYWQERFGGDRGILGQTIEVDTFRGGVYNIVGVMPSEFDFPSGTQIYLPIAFWGGGPLPAVDTPDRCCAWFNVIGRLKPGVTRERAQGEMTTIARRISERHRQAAPVTDVKVTLLRQELVGNHRTALLALFGAVGCVLLIACVNVANLLLSRVLARRGDMMIRAALGASTGQLVRQVMAESVVLTGIGAAAGILLAVWAQDVLRSSLAGKIPFAADTRIDWSVLAFAITVTLATAGLCGLAPIAHLRLGGIPSILQGRLRSHTEAPRGRVLRQALITGEVALAVVLAAGAGLLIRTVAKLESVNPGFQADRVLAMSFDFTASPFRGPGNQQPYFQELMTQVSGLPGVRRVGAVSEPPLSRRRLPDQAITIEGQPLRNRAESPQAIFQAISPGYLPALGIALKTGRLFTEADGRDDKLVAIVNETAARLYWRGEDPVGKRLAMGSSERFGYFRVPPRPGEPEWRQIIGVVSDIRSSALDQPPQPEVFFSYRQYPMYSPTLVVQTEGDPLALAPAVRQEALRLNSRAIVTGVRTLEQVAAESIAQPRLRARLVAVFSALALFLSGLGIYGVTSFTVAQRTQEIGIRMALGATASGVLWLIVRQAMRATGIGLALGIAGALAVGRWVSTLLYGVGPADPLSLVGASLLFTAAAIGASYIPARRAATVDPAEALRSG